MTKNKKGESRNIQNKKWQQRRNHWKRKKITRDFADFYANTFENLGKMDNFLGENRWPKIDRDRKFRKTNFYRRNRETY